MGQTSNLGLPPLLIAGILGMVLLALAIIFFVIIYQRRSFKQQQEMNKREREYQRNLLFASIQSQEEERKRISGDLHDSVGALLSVTKMYLQRLDIDLGTSELLTAKTEAIKMVNETILNVREISHNLLPPNLDRFGLEAALEDLFNKLDTTSLVELNFSSQNGRRFEVEKEIIVYRIIQELLNNTFKHADAKTIMLQLFFSKNHLQIQYTDDGIGFDLNPDIKARSLGLGLHNLESRTSILKADLTYDTQKGKGVKVTLHLPINTTIGA